MFLFFYKLKKCFNPHMRICLLILEKGREREKKRERENQCERETLISCLPYAPDPGSNLQPSVCPDWQSNCKLLPHGTMLPQTEPPGQGRTYKYF